MAQMILSTKQKQITDMEYKLLVPEERGRGLRWIGSLGLVDANCNIWIGWAMGSYCTAQGLCMMGHFAVQQKLKNHCKSITL